MPIESPLASSLRQDIQSVFDYLLSNELALATNNISIKKDDLGHIISWRAKPSLAYLFKGLPNSKTSIPTASYLMCVQNNDFCIQLFDGSLLQISYKVTSEHILWHRLCYYPCPFTFDTDELSEFGLRQLIEEYDSNYLFSISRMVTPIRFDYDCTNCDDIHSYSHVTLNDSNCRLPVSKPLHIGTFLKIIFDNFYSSDIDSSSALADISFFDAPERIVPPHNTFAYLNIV